LCEQDEGPGLGGIKGNQVYGSEIGGRFAKIKGCAVMGVVKGCGMEDAGIAGKDKFGVVVDGDE
jgi:hypothetical protein